MPPPTELTEHRNQRAKAAVIFVHGFTGKAENTWADFAGFLAAEKAVQGWDLFSVGYSTNLRIDLAGIWSADPDLDMVAKLLRTTTRVPPLEQYGALAIIAHSMNLVLKGSLAAAQAWARRALEHCSAAAKTETNPNAWRLATEAEANLLIGNSREAIELYCDAIATQPDPWQLESMYMQALETVRQLKNKQVAADLAQTFNKTLA